MRWSFFDVVTEVKYDDRIMAEKTFSKDEDFFYDHFPDMPIVPGVIQVEMIAQIGGRLIALSRHQKQENKKLVIPLLQGVENAVFNDSILAEQKVTITAKIVEDNDSKVKVSGWIKLPSGKLACKASINFAVFATKDPTGLDSTYGLPESVNMIEINDTLYAKMAEIKKAKEEKKRNKNQ